jgi:hypothetical protein
VRRKPQLYRGERRAKSRGLGGIAGALRVTVLAQVRRGEQPRCVVNEVERELGRTLANAMRLPATISVRLHSEDANSLHDLIVQMKVVAGTKNPRFILFPKTDDAGFAQLSAEDFQGQFDDHLESGLMDYNGDVSGASPIVELSLFDVAWSRENRDLALAWPLLRHERSKWQSRAQEYEYRISCRNADFIAAPVSANLSESSHLSLVVRTR